MPSFVEVPSRSTNPERKRHHFSRLLRSSPPRLPLQLKFGDTATAATACLSRSFTDTSGKVNVILCVHHSTGNTGGSLLTASAALGTIGPVLYPGHPLNLVSLRNDHDPTSGGQTQCVTADSTRNQVTLIDPTPMRRRGCTPIAKTFAFDAVLTNADAMADLCAVTLPEVIRAVLRGQDSCVLTIGHKHTGKTYSMLGSDEFATSAGIIPCAISWLYQLLDRQQDSQGIRYSVRISAVELTGPKETFHDLFSGVATSSDEGCTQNHTFSSASSNKLHHGVARQMNVDNSKTTGDQQQHKNSENEERASVAFRIEKQLSSQCELRATTMERAAQLLDIALANRRQETVDGLSHMLFTLHVYQCRVEQGEDDTKVTGKRTKLHLLDLGCGRYNYHFEASSNAQKRSRKCKGLNSTLDGDASGTSNLTAFASHVDSLTNTAAKSLSISGMANVLLALLTGQRHLPFRDSALTHLIKQAVTGAQMHPCILAHVASGAQYYTETLQVVQLASKLSKLRRRRVGGFSSSGMCKSGIPLGDTGSSSLDSFSDYGQPYHHRRRYHGPRLGRSSYARSTCSYGSELDFTSSSEQSCDTVIHLGQVNSSGPLSRAVSRLGPRGMADGSVDAASVSSGHWSAGESPSINPFNSAVWKAIKTTPPANFKTSLAMTGSVKRMIPRTNASVWPRHFSVRRAKPDLHALPETWVDGPKVAVTTSSTPTTQMIPGVKEELPISVDNGSKTAELTHTLPNSLSLMQSLPQPNTLSLSGQKLEDTHGHNSHSTAIANTVRFHGDRFCTTEYAPLEMNHRETRHSDAKMKEPIFEWQSSTTQSISSQSCTNSACTSGTHDSQRGQRALSDISEHTEDPETGPDCNTIKSDSTDHAVEHLALLNLDNLTPCNWTQPTQLNEQGKTQEMTQHSVTNSVTLMGLKHQLWGRSLLDTNGCGYDKLSPLVSEDTYVRHANHQSQEIRENRSTTSQISVHKRQDYSMNSERTSVVGSMKINNQQLENFTKTYYQSGCGEQTANLATFEEDTKSPGYHPNCSVIPLKSTTPSSCGNDGYFSGQSSVVISPPDSTAPWTYHRGKITMEAHSSASPDGQLGISSGSCPNNSLLRVAAWVNSIDHPLIYSTPKHSPGICMDGFPSTSPINKVIGYGRPSNDVSYQVPKEFSPSAMCPVQYSQPCQPVESNHLEPVSIHQPKYEVSSPSTETCLVNHTTEPHYVELERRQRRNPVPQNPVSYLPTKSLPTTPNIQHVGSRFSRQQHTPVIHHSNFSAHPNCMTEKLAVSRQHSLGPVPDKSYPNCCTPEIGRSRLYDSKLTSVSSTGTNRKNDSEVMTSSSSPPRIPPFDHILPKEHRSAKKTSKISGGFCFLTLPIFRNLRPRRTNKAKTEEQHRTQISGVDREFVLQTKSSHISLTNSPSTRCECKLIDHEKSAHWLCSKPSYAFATSPQTRIAQNSPQWRRNSQELAITTQVYNYAQVPNRCGEPFAYEYRGNAPSTGVLESTFGQNFPLEAGCKITHTSDLAQAGARNHSSGSSGVVSYTPSVPNNTYRSGLRSIIGGPASSGYESMRIGTSEISLSHQDSASECSGQMAPGYSLTKECMKQSARGVSTGNNNRRHSSTATNRLSGSPWSTVSNPSPMHISSLKLAHSIAAANAASALNTMDTQVTSFVGSKHQVSAQQNR